MTNDRPAGGAGIAVPSMDHHATPDPAAPTEMILSHPDQGPVSNIDLANVDTPFCLLDAHHRISWANGAFARMTRAALDAGAVDRAIAAALHPATTGSPAGRSNDSGGATEIQILAVASEPLWLALRATTVSIPSGNATAIYAVDVDRWRRTTERERLLREEMQHRLRNLLTVVGAIAHDLFSGANSTAATDQFTDRLNTLAAVASVEDPMQRRAPLSAIVDAVMRRFHDPGDERVDASGAAIEVEASWAQNFALVLHELATNSIKHGALGAHHGLVAIRWCIVRDAGPAQLHLDWRETGGPHVQPPEREGFGLSFIRRLVATRPSSRVAFRFPPIGFVCRLDLAILGDDAR